MERKRRLVTVAALAGTGLLLAGLIPTVAACVVIGLLFFQGRFWTGVAVSVTLVLFVVIAVVVGHCHEALQDTDNRIGSLSTDKVPTILIGLVPLLLIVLNLTVRGSYSAFYTPLRVLPEEVGFDAPTLVQLSGALLFFMAVGYLLLLAWFTSIAWTWRWWLHRRNELGAARYPGGLSLVSITVFALALTTIAAVHLRAEAADEVLEVQHGLAVCPIEPGGMTLVGVRAQSVSLHWTGTPPHDFQPTGTTLYLGQANGTLVLYEVNGGHIARVPTGAVVTRSVDTGSKC